MSNNIGDRKITTQIHPDSMGVRIWDVYEYRHAHNKYSPPEGTFYWERITPSIEPFTSEQEAQDFLKSLESQ